MATVMEPEVARVSKPVAPARPAGRRKFVFLLLGVALLGLVGMGVKRWWFGRTHVSTDNAQVDGHIIPILPKVGGFVADVRVRENQEVRAGDTLVVLDDRDFRSRLAQTDADLAALLATVSSRTRVGQAEAAVAQAQANAAKAHADLARMEPLAAKDEITKQQFDAYVAASRVAASELRASEEKLVNAQKNAQGSGASVEAAQARTG